MQDCSISITNTQEILQSFTKSSIQHLYKMMDEVTWHLMTFSVLTHWGQDKMAAILQRTFWYAFWGHNISVLWFTFNWNLFQGSYQNANIGWDNGFMLKGQQAIIWINDCLVYWCIYASLGLNKLKPVTTVEIPQIANIKDSHELYMAKHHPFLTHSHLALIYVLLITAFFLLL